MNPHEKSLRDSVLERIQGGEVRMRPKLYFVLRIIGTVLLSFLALILSSLIVSFIIFGLIQTGEHMLLGFGIQGLILFLTLFPWPLVLLDLLCIVGLLKLLSGFSIVYRTPHLPLYIALIATVILFGAFITLTPLHPSLLQSADRHQLPPPIGGAYEHIYDTHADRGIFRVRVATSTPQMLTVVRDDRDQTQGARVYTVYGPASTTLPVFTPGQYVLIFGTSTQSTITAHHIQLLPPPPPRDPRAP